jgi:hypothetical protein
MENEDLQILRYAALELQANTGDLVKIAGVVQKLKDWWSTRKNRKALRELKTPVEQAFKKLDEAVRSQDAETVDRITSEVLPTLLSDSVKRIENLRDSMLEHQEEYVGKGGNTLAGKNLRWVAKDYHKDKTLIQKLWEQLPEDFRSEVPVGRRINQPISMFSWYQKYGPENISISTSVKEAIWRNLGRLFDASMLDYMAQYYNQFLENLKFSILNDSMLEVVNFSPVSEQVKNRYSNEMRVELHLPPVAFPTGTDEIPIPIDKVILTDLGTRIPKRDQLSMLGVWFSTDPSNKLKNYKPPAEPIVEPQPEVKQESEPTVAADGPITRIVKRALIKKVLPKTQALVKINGQTFDYKTQFARVLASALRQEIDAECSVRHEGDDIEVQVEIYGSKMASLPAIFGISKYLADEFLSLTKMGIDVEVIPGISELKIIESEILDQSFRKVAFDCWRIR